LLKDVAEDIDINHRPVITRAALSTGERAKSKFLCAAFGL